MMIKPTVGRIVYFYRGVESAGDEREPRAAIIVYVLGDRCVNLAIFNQDGTLDADPPTSITLVQPGDERPANHEECFCEWMPYQVKKTTGSESGEKQAGTKTI